MTNDIQINETIGKTMYSSDEEKVGTVGQVFLDDNSGRPEFLTVNTGFFGTNESFVPAHDATDAGDRIQVPYTRDKIKDAPNVAVDNGHLDESQEAELYRYYGLAGPSFSEGDVTTTDDRADTEGYDTSGPTTDDAMTRSEERVNVGTAEEERGRVRLRKYVTTEHETHTVPVRKERAVVETEPVTDANVGSATDGPEISEEEHEVVLREERPVVEKTTEPVERVRLGTETETQEETVSEEVRKERIEAEGDVDDRRGDV